VKVINLFAGPGAGKSTTAAGLFFAMKTRGQRVELVTEFAKELTYEGVDMSNQLAMLVEQDRRLRRLLGKVDYAITDSPLPLSLIYAPPRFQVPWFTQTALGLFHSYDNRSFFIHRRKSYQTYGRSQSEVEAREIDHKILDLIDDHSIPWTPILGDSDAPERILAVIG
jgi:AAA domain